MKEADMQIQEAAPASVEIAILGGMTHGGKVRDSRIANITDLGLEIHDGMTRARWRELIFAIKRFKDASDIMLADAIDFGVRKFGADAVKADLAQLEFEMPDIERASRIRLVPRSLRSASLIGGHYAVVADLPEPQQAHWLRLAVEHRLTPLDLSASIDAGQVVQGGGRRALPAASQGLINLPSIHVSLTRWKKMIDAKYPIDTWERADLEKAVEELAPAAEILSQIKARLAAA